VFKRLQTDVVKVNISVNKRRLSFALDEDTLAAGHASEPTKNLYQQIANKVIY
jgi:hypothetical protein